MVPHVRRISNEKRRSIKLAEWRLPEVDQLNLCAAGKPPNREIRTGENRREWINLDSHKPRARKTAARLDQKSPGAASRINHAARRRHHREPVQHRLDDRVRGVCRADLPPHFAGPQRAKCFPERVFTLEYRSPKAADSVSFGLGGRLYSLSLRR